ncbi:MAG: glycosyltransferase [Erysipelotrichaceae bacterium]
MKNKILAITGAFLPYNDTVTLLAYKHLRRTGLEADVIALSANEDRNILNDFENDPYRNKVKIIYSKAYHDTIAGMQNKNVFKGMMNVFLYCKDACKRYKEVNYQYVYTSSIPCFTHLAGYWIKKKNRDVKWIASFSDPINKSPYKYDKETFIEYSIIEKIGFLVYIFLYMNAYYEKIAMKHADRLVFICEEQRDFMIQNYPRKKRESLLAKSIIIPLNYIEEWDLYKELMGEDNYTLNPCKTIVHMGRIYGLRNFKNIILAIKELNDEIEHLECKLQIVQYGEFLNRYKKMIEEYNLGNLFVYKEKVSYGQGIQIMKEADALLLVDTIFDDEQKIQPYLPSKIMEYFLLRKPIVAIANQLSPTYRLMKENDLACSQNNVEDIKCQFRDLIVMDTYSASSKVHENKEIMDVLKEI